MITANEAAKRMIVLGYLLRGEPVPDVIEIPPPQVTHYEPMHIPAWWHEEYLKSLEPKPPFDPIGFFDRLAYNICMFFGRLGDAIFSGLTGKPSEPHKSFWFEQDKRNNGIERMLND